MTEQRFNEILDKYNIRISEMPNDLEHITEKEVKRFGKNLMKINFDRGDGRMKTVKIILFSICLVIACVVFGLEVANVAKIDRYTATGIVSAVATILLEINLIRNTINDR